MDLNLFQREDIARGVSTFKYAGGTEFIPVSYLQDTGNADKLDKKMLKLFVLSCTSGGNVDIKRITSNPKYGNKKAKISSSSAQNQQFNRMFICADLRQPPKVCAIITRNATEVNVLMNLIGGEPFVGMTFFLFEPGLVLSTLGDHTPILDWKSSAFIPVEHSQRHLSTTEPRFTLPHYVGMTHYFVLTEKRIKITSIKYSPVLTCLGIQCDRQKSKHGCSCIHASGTGNSNVFECSVTFDVPEKVDMSGKVTVSQFQSYKLTKFFFKSFEDFAQSHDWNDVDDSQNLIRRKWERLVQYINNHGGWTLVGWCMLGDHYDAAGGSDKVQNFETRIHLSMVQPTNEIRADDVEVNRLKINESFVSVHQLPDNSDSDSDREDEANWRE